MRSTMRVQRRPDSFGPMQIGEKASRVLRLARRVSDIRIESQFVDQVVLSYEDNDQLGTFCEIDELLAEANLLRV